MSRLPSLLDDDPLSAFPPPEQALREPDGLLAIGGDLSVPRLLNAYRAGIFPWYSDGQPILWWSPDPRAMFATAPGGVHLSRRFRRGLRGSTCVVQADRRFDEVLHHCATVPRAGQSGTWITDDMARAYRELHRQGHAHSIEVIDGDRLVAGLYGVAVGRMFYGESMFSLATGGSTLALAALARRLNEWGWPWLDAQVSNPHLVRLGAIACPRPGFLRLVAAQCDLPGVPGPWTTPFGEVAAASLADGSI